MVFIDTGGWIAVAVASDGFHADAVSCYENLLARRIPLLTSSYVLDETITRIRYDAGHAVACRFADIYAEAEKQGMAATLWVDEPAAAQAMLIFRQYSDQKLSFTDCTSFALMKNHGIAEAFSFDRHFEMMGFIRIPHLRHN